MNVLYNQKEKKKKTQITMQFIQRETHTYTQFNI